MVKEKKKRKKDLEFDSIENIDDIVYNDRKK